MMVEAQAPGRATMMDKSIVARACKAPSLADSSRYSHNASCNFFGLLIYLFAQYPRLVCAEDAEKLKPKLFFCCMNE